ncbi:hypothetical protein niasHT_003754 [Heterodera trifolii]|uniref:Alanine-glyoxylate aminotransferase n=1 Tax=Heterodera trifolii TaxID=157864 RepID=A0ABD2LUQ1_9BILA
MDYFTQFIGHFPSFGTLFTKQSSESEKEQQLQQHNIKKDETNGGRGEMATEKAELVAKRAKMISSKCQTFYAEEPILVTRASMQFLFDENGRRFLDCISNVQRNFVLSLHPLQSLAPLSLSPPISSPLNPFPSFPPLPLTDVGHCHPRVVEAVHCQMRLSTCNIRFLSPLLTECAESLLQTLPAQLDTVLFCNSGSEANDLALQLARDWTGAKDVAVLEHAYHGHQTTAMQMSPYKFDRGAKIKQPKWVHVCPTPDLYRGKYRLKDDEFEDEKKRTELCIKYVEDIRQTFEQAQIKGRKVGAFIAEALQSCGGQVMPPKGYFRRVAEVVHALGGVVVVDEVQTGFGRVGDAFWAYQLDRDREGDQFIPDIVTMGKPMGNGHPVAAVVTRREIADRHCGEVCYFNTYGGNPVSCAAALSVLKVIREENLLEHCREMGKLFRKELNALKERHQSVGDVRGAGMFWGVDLVKSRRSREPNSELAQRVILRLKRQDGVLLSSDGPYGNILKFKPPLCFGEDDLRKAVNALDKALAEFTTEEEKTK